MERTLNMVFLATIALAALFQSSLAQTDHIVGDALGWLIPPGSSVYTTWAANKTFRVGDTLVFNFPNNGEHDVSKVTRVYYDSCNAKNSILTLSKSPAKITLNDTGSHYFICGITGHCTAGQKLAINVIAAGSTSSPATQPPTAAPQQSRSVSGSTYPSAVYTCPAAPFGPIPSPSSSSSITPPTSSSSPSPSPSIEKPPSSTDSPLSPNTPSTPSPASDNNSATPPTLGSSATSPGVTGLTVTFISLIVAFFM